MGLAASLRRRRLRRAGNVAPLTEAERIGNYHRQNCGGKGRWKSTPRQRRRLDHKARSGRK